MMRSFLISVSRGYWRSRWYIPAFSSPNFSPDLIFQFEFIFMFDILSFDKFVLPLAQSWAGLFKAGLI